MDIMLERILSLLPRKPDGGFKHGAKKEFAQSIGYDSGDIVSIWISGGSQSYKNKLHEISVKYGVSVEWLKGETNKKTPAPKIKNERSAKEVCLEKIDELAEKGSNQELLDLLAAITEKLRK